VGPWSEKLTCLPSMVTSICSACKEAGVKISIAKMTVNIIGKIFFLYIKINSPFI